MEDQPRWQLSPGPGSLGTGNSHRACPGWICNWIALLPFFLQAEETAEEIRSLGVPVFLLPANLRIRGKFNRCSWS